MWAWYCLNITTHVGSIVVLDLDLCLMQAEEVLWSGRRECSNSGVYLQAGKRFVVYPADKGCCLDTAEEGSAGDIGCDLVELCLAAYPAVDQHTLQSAETLIPICILRSLIQELA